MSEERTLVKKLATVMKEVRHIEKKGWNAFAKYKYATESDVAEKVREVLAELNVIMLPDVIEHTTREHTNRKGFIEYISTVKVKFTFMDGDSGESLSIHSVGEGQDSGDKAVYKAITGAQKYALMKAFMIPTGDDPESDSGTDERNANQQNNQQRPPQQNNNAPSDAQRNALRAITNDLAKKTSVGQGQVYTSACGALGIQKPSDQLTKQEMSKIIDYLKKQQESLNQQ